MKRLISLVVVTGALAFAGSAAAALQPWTFTDTGVTCAVSSTFSNGTLHLAKPCTTETVASAGATITGVDGQTFSSASFTLASAAQCQGGSPRFNVTTSVKTYFLGCNNVAPTLNADGTATYTFNAATIAAGNTPDALPTGTIQSVNIVLDVQGSADLTKITFNGQAQVPQVSGPGKKHECKHGGWRTFTSPTFKNQGRCVSWFNHQHRHHHHHHHH